MRDKFLLSLPMFGPLIKQRVVARFASTLSTLLGSGLEYGGIAARRIGSYRKYPDEARG